MKITLTAWKPEDRLRLAEMTNLLDRRFLSDRIPYPYTLEDADWYIGMAAEHDGKDSIFRAITVDGVIAGTISVEEKADVYACDAEVGYYLMPEYYGKGIMTEAVRQICEAAFETLPLARITGQVYAPNIASQRVLQKNGFVQEGCKKRAVHKNGAYYDLLIFGKLRAEII